MGTLHYCLAFAVLIGQASLPRAFAANSGSRASARLQGTPTAPMRQAPSLDPARLSLLRSLLVADLEQSVYSESGFRAIANVIDFLEPSPRMMRLHSPQGFKALVEGLPQDREELLEDVKSQGDMMTGVKNLMYFSLVQLFESGLPLGEAMGIGEALSSHYAEFFDGLSRDAGAPAMLRAQAEKAGARLRDPRHLLVGLARARDLNRRWTELESMRRSFHPTPAAAAKERQWQVPPFKPISERSFLQGPPKTFVQSLSKTAEEIAEARFRLEGLLARRRLASGPPFSKDLRRRLDAEVSGELDALDQWLPYWKITLQRFSQITIGRSFLDRREHRITGVPRHPGLRLVRDGLVFILRARFKTDIHDPAIRQVVKDSIEDYWEGGFTFAGRRHLLRTEVSIEPLRPGEGFPHDYLRLIDGKNGPIYAGFSEIFLGRNPLNFTYDVPAHEFGHVLGLVDEYTERYDPETGEGIHTNLPGSLMGDRNGAVQGRHLKLVYQLLRRHRLHRGLVERLGWAASRAVRAIASWLKPHFHAAASRRL